MINIERYLYTADLAKFTSDLADTFTYQIMSGLNTTDPADAGDNANRTVLKGEAHFNENYIEVRWPWLIVPLLETLLACILLVATIVVTWNEVIFKTSLAALLVHGLDGWSEVETDVSAPETAEKLEKMTKHMSAVLEQDPGGRLKFVRK